MDILHTTKVYEIKRKYGCTTYTMSNNKSTQKRNCIVNISFNMFIAVFESTSTGIQKE